MTETNWRWKDNRYIRRFLLFMERMKGGEMNMVDIYVALVLAKRRTCIPEKATKKIKLVPASVRPEVLEDLLAIGIDGNGDPITSEE